MTRLLSRAQARAAYDRIGRFQDTQAFYEDPAVSVMLEHSAVDAADDIFELGCGTGRVAEKILRSYAQPTASYEGIDLSPEMVRLAQHRLAQFGSRASVRLVDGDPRIGAGDSAYDFAFSTFVFDLLSETEIARWLAELARVVRPGGRVGLASLTSGTTSASSLFTSAWTGLHRLRPALVGGCRPIGVTDLVGTDWTIVFRDVVVARILVPSEVLVLEHSAQ